MEGDYSKRELDQYFNSLKELILSVTKNQNEKLDRIENEIKNDHIRMAKIEADIEEYKIWKATLMGKLGVIGVVGAGIWTLLLTLFKHIF